MDLEVSKTLVKFYKSDFWPYRRPDRSGEEDRKFLDKTLKREENFWDFIWLEQKGKELEQ